MRAYLQEPGVTHLRGTRPYGGLPPGPDAGRRPVPLPVAGCAGTHGERGGIVTVSVAEETAVNAEGRRGRVHGRGRQRGRCVPAVIPALAARTESGRCGFDDLSRTSGSDGCDCGGVCPRQLAEMSDTLPDQPAHPGARGLQPWVVRGGGCAPCTNSRHRESRTRSLRASSIGRVTGSPMSRRCCARPESTAGVVHQPPGVAEQRDPAADRRGGNLPQPVGATPGHRRRTGRAARRVVDRRELRPDSLWKGQALLEASLTRPAVG